MKNQEKQRRKRVLSNDFLVMLQVSIKSVVTIPNRNKTISVYSS